MSMYKEGRENMKILVCSLVGFVAVAIEANMLVNPAFEGIGTGRPNFMLQSGTAPNALQVK